MIENPHVGTTPENQEAIEELESLQGGVNKDGDFEPSPELESEQLPESNNIPTAELLGPIIGLLCASVAPAWDISPDEQSNLCEAYGALADKYFPEGVPMGPEVGAVLVTASIVMPRLGQPLKIEEKKEADNGDQSEHGASE